ncbi:metal-dependent transcriptional regulator [Bdellovibrionota bacterium FG-2]
MAPNERQEEVLEAIWMASEKKEYSAEAIKKECSIGILDSDLSDLEKTGLLIKSGDKILFSKDGKSLAEMLIRRHRLAEVLVHTILKLKNTQMEEIACKVEHTLLPEIEESICTLLGHPEWAPDGNPIPPGKCCGQKLRTVASVVTALSELKPGENAKLMYIRPSSHSQLHQLLSFGLNPGVILDVHQTSPAFCIKFGNTELALDKDTASNIFVLRTKET